MWTETANRSDWANQAIQEERTTESNYEIITNNNIEELYNTIRQVKDYEEIKPHETTETSKGKEKK